MSKKYKHFKKSDRLEISILLKKGYSQRNIANALKKTILQ
ncbi:MAG: helix-turn-helix domain-containing protein [Candidatus Moranbacteria bacterium]|nr:helix-turn-helix domain-containing protein [Candidatus Moranbacteria bacterium]